MSCYHPLYRLPAFSRESLLNRLLPFLPDESSKLVSNDEKVVWDLTCKKFDRVNPGPIKSGAIFVSEKEAEALRRLSGDDQFVQDVPCGQCIGCRVARSEEWAYRIMLEAVEAGENCHFLTLTYSEDFVPTTYSIHPKFGLEMVCHPLQKKDFQDFMKRFRYYYGDGIRFFACGEYGDSSGRAHYHCIIIGAKIDDLVYLKKCGGHPVFNSALVDQIWGKGFVVIGSVTPDSALYCAKYCTKTITGKARAEYEQKCRDRGLEPLPPEFILMSRRPGLGRSFFDREKDQIFRFTRVVIPGGRLMKQPRYFENLYKFDDPAVLKKLRQRRQQAVRAHQSDSDLSRSEQLRVNERVRLSQERVRDFDI